MSTDKILQQMKGEYEGKTIFFKDLDKSKTALIVVDMVNGFLYEGALASPRVDGIVNEISTINDNTLGYKKVFFIDSHEENSEEFKSYPPHCLENSTESELIPQLRNDVTNHSNTIMVPKNSTNGFHAPLFKKWLEDNINIIDNFVICGCVTDICVMTFALTLNSYFNELNMKKRLIVPINAVETYSFGSHDGDLMNIFALYNMKINGIEIVDRIVI